MEHKAFIFDLDGTLLNTLEDLKNSVNFAMRSMGYPEHTLEQVRMYIGNGIAMLIKRAVPPGTDESDEKKTLTVFIQHYNAHLNDCTVPYPGVTRSLTALKKRGVKIGVVTNKNDDSAKMLINKYFGNLVDVTLGHITGLPSKPNPEALLRVMSDLGVNSEETLYFGDSDVDVLTAKNAGVKCVGVSWGFRGEEVLLKAGADIILTDPYAISDLK